MRSASIRLMLAALVAGAAGVAGAAAPCPDALAGEAGLVPGGDPCGTTGERSPCVQLRRSTCRELAQITSAPIVACASAPAQSPPPVAIAIEIAAPRPRAANAAAVLGFAPKTSPPQG